MIECAEYGGFMQVLTFKQGRARGGVLSWLLTDTWNRLMIVHCAQPKMRITLVGPVVTHP